jgi:BirA family biotin operon repressor/biotin-[acetyl-CoA-carboxylase] ligase
MDLTHARLEQIRHTRPLRYFERTVSTNTLALAWIAEGAAAGSLVLTDEQTEGRGRLGRSWFAPADSALLLSYILYPPPEYAAQATMLGALAVAETSESLGIADVGIKYPNDVQINRLKVCGILAEATWQSGKVGIALGIGLNVRVNFADTPYADSAISLEMALDRPLSRADVLNTLLDRLDFWRGKIGDRALFEAWRSRLNMLGEFVEINTGEALLSGTASDVDRDGALLLTDETNTTRRIFAGDLVVYR